MKDKENENEGMANEEEKDRTVVGENKSTVASPTTSSVSDSKHMHPSIETNESIQSASSTTSTTIAPPPTSLVRSDARIIALRPGAMAVPGNGRCRTISAGNHNASDPSRRPNDMEEMSHNDTEESILVNAELVEQNTRDVEGGGCITDAPVTAMVRETGSPPIAHAEALKPIEHHPPTISDFLKNRTVRIILAVVIFVILALIIGVVVGFHAATHDTFSAAQESASSNTNTNTNTNTTSGAGTNTTNTPPIIIFTAENESYIEGNTSGNGSVTFIPSNTSASGVAGALLPNGNSSTLEPLHESSSDQYNSTFNERNSSGSYEHNSSYR